MASEARILLTASDQTAAAFKSVQDGLGRLNGAAGLMAIPRVLSRGASVLFLSEHPGDGTPGSKVILRLHGIATFREELLARPGSAATPDIEERPWGWRDMEIADPFGNRLVFSERIDPEGS